MTCSARLPVYALISERSFRGERCWGGLELQGVCVCALHRGCRERMTVALCSSTVAPVAGFHPLMSNCPPIHWNVCAIWGMGLWQRVENLHDPRRHHHSRADGDSVGLSSFPAPPPGAAGRRSNTCRRTFGRLGGLPCCSRAIGFNWQISIALVPDLRRARSPSARWAP